MKVDFSNQTFPMVNNNNLIIPALKSGTFFINRFLNSDKKQQHSLSKKI